MNKEIDLGRLLTIFDRHPNKYSVFFAVVVLLLAIGITSVFPYVALIIAIFAIAYFTVVSICKIVTGEDG